MIMSELKVSAYTAESGHWYTRNGEPMYQIEGANGKIRNTTLRDARKHNLVPSVTTILNVAAKPGLENWKLQQVLLAALTLPKQDQESEKDYIDRIIADSKEQGKSAADAGTEIHASVEKFFEKNVIVGHEQHVRGVEREIKKVFGDQDWICERPFAHESGFGGKVDMFARGKEKSDEGIVLDIKTKEFWDPEKVEGYDEHMMQLAAYRVGLGMQSAKCANVFVSRSVPGLVKIVEWRPEDLMRGWKMFYRLLEFWQLKNSYK
jgi:hypothetical protein